MSNIEYRRQMRLLTIPRTKRFYNIAVRGQPCWATGPLFVYYCWPDPPDFDRTAWCTSGSSR